MEEFAAGFVHAFVGVGAEVIALRLEQIRRQTRVAIAVEEGQRGAEGRHRNALLDRQGDDVAPTLLAALDLAPEVIVEQQIRELRILVVGLLDLAQEARPNDAPAAPHQGDAAVVQVPAILLRGGAQQHIALRVADDLGGVEGTHDVLDQRLLLHGILGLGKHRPRALQFAGGLDAFVLHGADAAGEDRLGDQGHGLGQIGGIDHRPLAGALLAGGIEDFVHQRETILVLLGQNVSGDFDQEAIEFSGVPFVEDRGHFVGAHAQAIAHQAVGLADQLHVTVLDAVVDHLDVVSGTAAADPVAAGGTAVDLGGDALEDVLHMWPGGGAAAGHDAGTESGAFFAAGDAGADVEQALGFEQFHPAIGVAVERIATVDDDVTGFQVRQDLLNELVHRRARFDHHHDPPGLFELRHEFGDGMGALDLGALRLVREEVVHLGGGAVVGHDGEAVVVHVENQILAHDGQADHCDIAGRSAHVDGRTSRR